MKKLIALKIEKHVEKGETYFVATSDDVQGLVVEGETLESTIETAYDVARDLLKVQNENKKLGILTVVPQIFSYSLMVEA